MVNITINLYNKGLDFLSHEIITIPSHLITFYFCFRFSFVCLKMLQFSVGFVRRLILFCICEMVLDPSNGSCG